jgi:hypothetical protein
MRSQSPSMLKFLKFHYAAAATQIIASSIHKQRQTQVYMLQISHGGIKQHPLLVHCQGGTPSSRQTHKKTFAVCRPLLTVARLLQLLSQPLLLTQPGLKAAAPCRPPMYCQRP